MSENVRIRLITRDEDVKVDDSPIYVPIDLKRYGLSEIVNQLLQTTEPIPFDFLIDGKLLRTSVGNYLTSQGLSTESIVTLEYVRAVLPPQQIAAFEHEDWVSCVDISRKDKSIVTGSYDGIVRIWNESGVVTDTMSGHSGAVKAVKWIGADRLVSGSADRKICLWRYSTESSKPKKQLSCILTGHTGSINDIAVVGDQFVSASNDGTVRVWTSKVSTLPQAPTEPTSKNTQSQKRRKMAEQALRENRVRTSLSTLQGHTAPVMGVTAHGSEPHVAYSVGEDHTIRTWDLVTGSSIDTRTASFPLLCITNLGPSTSLVACGSAARHILLHDPRASVQSGQTQLVGHTNFVVSLAPSPTNSYQLASASHDGTMRIWDIRAGQSMFTVTAAGQDNDLYAVDWSTLLVAGGRNKKLEICRPN